MKSLPELIEDFKRDLLAGYLDQLEDDQWAFFKRLWPGTVPTDQLDTAINLCQMTIRKNNEGT